MWIVEHVGGRVSQHHDIPGTAGIEQGVRFAEVPRELDLLVERWDFAAHAIVAIPAGYAQRIDQGHRANHGLLSIEMAHIQKAVEAQLILAGTDLPDGLVAAEAAATGVTVHGLAATIVEKQAAANATEVARRVAKMAG